MLNQYETVFIATPVLSEIQMKETVQKFKMIITDNGGEIVHEENWGLRKLAYPIQKKSTAFIILLNSKQKARSSNSWKYNTVAMKELSGS